MFEKIEEKISPIINKISHNVIIQSIADGFSVVIPLLIVGSIFTMLVYFPIEAVSNFFALVKIGESSLADLFIKVSGATTGVLALFATAAISNSYAKKKGVDPFMGILTSLTVWIYLMPSNADGLVTSWFGPSGLFIGMLVVFVSLTIYAWVTEKGWVIKMPKGTPSAVDAGFSGLIPIVIVVIVFVILNSILTAFNTNAFDLIYNLLQQPLKNLSTSLPGFIIAALVMHLLWWMGIHGSSIINAILGPLLLAASAENLAYLTTGVGQMNIIDYSFFNFYFTLGGAGNTLALLIVALLFAKSKRVKTVSKLATVPGLFNINEPVVYGMPIMLNPIFFIPYVFTPVINTLISYTAINIGLVAISPGVTIAWTCPPIIAGFLVSGIGGAILQLVLLVVNAIIYFPFLKMLDNKSLSEEDSLDESDALGNIDLDSIDL